MNLNNLVFQHKIFEIESTKTNFSYEDIKFEKSKKIYTINGRQYKIIDKKERYLPASSFARIKGIALGTFMSLVTLGILPIFSKSVRELFTGKQIINTLKEVKTKRNKKESIPKEIIPISKTKVKGKKKTKKAKKTGVDKTLETKKSTMILPKNSPFPGVEFQMEKWLNSDLNKYPKDYQIGAKEEVLEAVMCSKTIVRFKKRIDLLESHKKLTPSAANRLKNEFKRIVKSHYYLLEGNQRPGKKDIKIMISIARCSHLTLTEKNLGEIFKIANQYTLNTRYAIQNTSKLIKGKMVHRPNHNGTHSARQVGYLEAMFDLIEKDGLPHAKQQLSQLTQDEKLNLKLAAYFLRAGRVDESSHKSPPADDYYSRSALIYEAYAKQLGVDGALIHWVKSLIIDSCKPLLKCQEVHKSEKSKFAYDLLSTAHELDLVRCFGQKHITENMKETEIRLNSLIHHSSVHVSELYDFAKLLCEKTGASRTVDGHKGNPQLFADCSLDGGLCWEAIQQAGLPNWA